MKKFIILFFFCACIHSSSSPTPKPENDKCSEACIKLRILGCEEGQPLPDGTTCEEFCRHSQYMGHELQSACILERVNLCDDMIDLESTCTGFAPH